MPVPEPMSDPPHQPSDLLNGINPDSESEEDIEVLRRPLIRADRVIRHEQVDRRDHLGQVSQRFRRLFSETSHMPMLIFAKYSMLCIQLMTLHHAAIPRDQKAILFQKIYDLMQEINDILFAHNLTPNLRTLESYAD